MRKPFGKVLFTLLMLGFIPYALLIGYDQRVCGQTVTWPPPPPFAFIDLATMNAFSDKATPLVGEPVIFGATIANLGTDPAINFRVDCYLDAILLGTGWFSLSGGSSMQVKAGPWIATEGYHTVRWVADSLNVIPEPTKTNNIADLTFMVSSKPYSPTQAFVIEVTPMSAIVARGESTQFSVRILPVASGVGTVTLSLSGLPSATNHNFNPPSGVPPGLSTLTISTTPSTPLGAYSLTIKATGGAAEYSRVVGLTVVSKATEVTLSCNPSSVTIGLLAFLWTPKVTISIAVTPPHVSKIDLEISIDNGATWKKSAATALCKTGPDGKVEITETIREEGTYLFRAISHGDAYNPYAMSQIVKLEAKRGFWLW